MIRGTTVFLFCFCYFAAAEVGDRCTRNGATGTCELLSNCKTAIDGLKKKIFPQICSFVGTETVVCCAGYTSITTTPRAPVATTPKVKPTRPAADPPMYEAIGSLGGNDDDCEPVPPSLTSTKTGQKAWDKCLEYQHDLVYPCQNSQALIGSKVRTRRCHHDADELIINGVNALPDEFSHMVLIGYGAELSKVQWLCGGSLISDQYVLTAGHCIFNRDRNPISYALMGTLKRSDAIDPAKLRKVVKIIPHPDYKPPSKYHDIALLRLETPLTLSEYLVPACLQVPSDLAPAERALATGWGHTRNKQLDSEADNLQKVILNKYSVQECSEIYQVHRHLLNGYDNTTQICYGDKTKDTCQGDSGGPLQIKSKNISCMYTVIGITSFGSQCGIGFPGVYTRVSKYIPWIEKEVWP